MLKKTSKLSHVYGAIFRKYEVTIMKNMDVVSTGAGITRRQFTRSSEVFMYGLLHPTIDANFQALFLDSPDFMIVL